MVSKPHVGETVVHPMLGPCVVDNAELINPDSRTVFVKFNDDMPTVQVYLTCLKKACVVCYGKGKKDIDEIRIDCDACNGTGYEE
jgi:hypothetical protein